MILVVSDLHLGYEKADKNAFLEFLDGRDWNKIDRLILLGDIFDFWRGDNLGIMSENKEVIEKFNDIKTNDNVLINYIVGNHDYFLYTLAQRYGTMKKGQWDYGPFMVSKTLKIEQNDQKFFFIHGYELEVFSFSEAMSVDLYEKFSNSMANSGALTGEAASKVWDVIQAGTNVSKSMKKALEDVPQRLFKKPGTSGRKMDKLWSFALSPEARSMILGMNYGETLIFGHTHKPQVCENVINTGAWIEEGKNTYLKIKDGKIESDEFIPRNTDETSRITDPLP